MMTKASYCILRIQQVFWLPAGSSKFVQMVSKLDEPRDNAYHVNAV